MKNAKKANFYMRRFPANDTGVYPTPKDPKTPGFAFVAILPLICQEIQFVAQIRAYLVYRGPVGPRLGFLGCKVGRGD